MNKEVKKYYMEVESLPPLFPTNRHAPSFWEGLGRAVATFGFLEDVLGRAIFALSATREYVSAEELEEAYEKWEKKLECALTESLGNLITAYENEARGRSGLADSTINDLVSGLRNVAQWRNIICHGSWQIPDSEGRSVPRFFSRKGMIDMTLDLEYISNIQKQTAELACEVISSVALEGIQFPGSNGPGICLYSVN